MTEDAAEGREGTSAIDPRAWRRALAEGRFEEAERSRLLLVRAGEEDDDEEEGRAVRALADLQGLVRSKRWARARERLERLEARPPALLDWDALQADVDQLQRGAEALDRRDAPAALAALDETKPNLLRAEHATQRGTALILEGYPEEAGRAFEDALEADPKHHRAWTNLGNVALEEQRVDDAIGHYQQALALDEAFANAHHNLGVAYRRKGQIGKSVRALRRAQRVTRRADGEEARASLRRGAGGGGNRRLRWALWAAAFAAVLWFLASRGGV